MDKWVFVLHIILAQQPNQVVLGEATTSIEVNSYKECEDAMKEIASVKQLTSTVTLKNYPHCDRLN